MKMNCRIKFDGKRLENAAAKGGRKGLPRAAAYVRGVARRKIRYRKHKTSRPGQPPYDHRTFRQAIHFAVDDRKLSAYIGPERLSGKPANPGGPVPNTLEFGGAAAPTANSAWWTKKAPAMTSVSEVAGFLRGTGYGPLFMGRSHSAVVAQGRGKKKAGPGFSGWENRIRKRKNPITGRNVFYLQVPLKSQKMAEKAARNIVDEFGYPTVTRAVIRPRPFMGPSLADSRSQLAKFWANTI